MYHGGVTGGGNAMIKILNLAKSDKNAARKYYKSRSSISKQAKIVGVKSS